MTATRGGSTTTRVTYLHFYYNSLSSRRKSPISSPMAPLKPHPFPVLPKELRIIIWRFSLPSPCIIQPYFTQLASLNQYGFTGPLYSYTTITFSLPLSIDISAVNTEVRDVFYTAYESIEALDINH